VRLNGDRDGATLNKQAVTVMISTLTESHVPLQTKWRQRRFGKCVESKIILFLRSTCPIVDHFLAKLQFCGSSSKINFVLIQIYLGV
jgi:hypothetical protein